MEFPVHSLELLCRILGFASSALNGDLASVRLTCRAWRDSATAPAFWAGAVIDLHSVAPQALSFWSAFLPGWARATRFNFDLNPDRIVRWRLSQLHDHVQDEDVDPVLLEAFEYVEMPRYRPDNMATAAIGKRPMRCSSRGPSYTVRVQASEGQKFWQMAFGASCESAGLLRKKERWEDACYVVVRARYAELLDRARPRSGTLPFHEPATFTINGHTLVEWIRRGEDNLPIDLEEEVYICGRSDFERVGRLRPGLNGDELELLNGDLVRITLLPEDGKSGLMLEMMVNGVVLGCAPCSLWAGEVVYPMIGMETFDQEPDQPGVILVQ
mmetsp:Transcript_101380/g.226387  ORF Transcript_101380/g.226387 Transcript_101380/m.226387 type:complete len:327 (+) Transcript_101380:39-1019(+)